MAAQYVMASKAAANRCTSAAACSSARMTPILDTALLLAVSICVLGPLVLPIAA